MLNIHEDPEVTIKNGHAFFWGSVMSQWFIRPMEVGGVRYNCCEQWMMAGKARLFGDEKALGKIMGTDSPKEQKALGRTVKGFVPCEWDAACRRIVYEGNLAKFSQHEDLRQYLLGSGDLVIVEASPHDRIWGIGMKRSEPGVEDPKNWRGKNWLGEAIMEARRTIRAGA
jgi:ribA/ribD-fused uncharacterized protein